MRVEMSKRWIDAKRVHGVVFRFLSSGQIHFNRFWPVGQSVWIKAINSYRLESRIISSNELPTVLAADDYNEWRR